MANVGRAKNIL